LILLKTLSLEVYYLITRMKTPLVILFLLAPIFAYSIEPRQMNEANQMPQDVTLRFYQRSNPNGGEDSFYVTSGADSKRRLIKSLGQVNRIASHVQRTAGWNKECTIEGPDRNVIAHIDNAHDDIPLGIGNPISTDNLVVTCK
jgi:hypothetical protein